MLAGMETMTAYETASLTLAGDALYVAAAAAGATIVSALTSPIIAWLMWRGIKEMVDANKNRAKQAAEDRKDAAKDRKEAQEQAAAERKMLIALAQATLQAAQATNEGRKEADEDRKEAEKKADENQKILEGLLGALDKQGKALEEIIRRTNAPGNVTELPKRGGKPQPGPAE